MKKNIDLTLRRDFYVKDSELKDFFRLISLKVHKHKKTPWRTKFSIINHESELADSSKNGFKNIIYTGNKENRKIIKLQLNYDFICERCGTPLTKIPWFKYHGLCKLCFNEIYGKYKEKGFIEKEIISKQICWK